MKYFPVVVALGLLFGAHVDGKTIAEKKASLVEDRHDLQPELQRELVGVNRGLTEDRTLLESLYLDVNRLYDEGASEETFREQLARINAVKTRLHESEGSWRRTYLRSMPEGGYALWHQPDTTIGQLVIDYGSQDFVYVMPPDIADERISVASNLPIPSAAWSDMLELILTQNGIGVRRMNPFVSQLYRIRDDRSNIRLITADRNDLQLLPPRERVAFVLTPQPADVRRMWQFLEKFSNPGSTTLQIVGRDIFVIAPNDEVQDLLKLYDFMAANRGDKEYKVVALRRVNSEEMGRILTSVFEGVGDNIPFATDNDSKKKAPRMEESADSGQLRVITLQHIAHAVFLIGTKEEIKKAEEIIREVEAQVGGAKEKVIHWYTVKNGHAEDLATVLSKVYPLMSQAKCENPCGDRECPIEDLENAAAALQAEQIERTGLLQPFPPRNIFDTGYFLDDSLVVDDSPGITIERDPNRHRNNFLVDLKTNAIVMVVEADLLPQIKNLIQKLDVPVKMVQLEVLLFEKRVKKENDFGLNLLKIGNAASDTHSSSAIWNDSHLTRGIFQYLLSREKGNGGLPAFDLIYKFLMTQDDITINSTPSVLALNQTKANINIEEEISVNTGVFEIPTEGAVALKDAFARARYGTKIEIIPTIHESGEEGDPDEIYVTLETDIIFETILKSLHPQRPDVIRRVVKNQVRIPDGQTVILGGLRRKVTEDKKEMIPFIGELPGFGKLFSMTEMEDMSTEMYIFITPTVVKNPQEDLCRIRTRELCRRPGDIPLFLKHLDRARECERTRLMAGAMDMLFGREPPRVEIPLGEYDGRTRCSRG